MVFLGAPGTNRPFLPSLPQQSYRVARMISLVENGSQSPNPRLEVLHHPAVDVLHVAEFVKFN